MVKQNYTNIDKFINKKRGLQIKNATAFGYPISEITLDDELNNQYLTVHFKNNDFMALLPSFYAKLDNPKIPAGKKVAYLKHTYPNKKSKNNQNKLQKC